MNNSGRNINKYSDLYDRFVRKLEERKPFIDRLTDADKEIFTQWVDSVIKSGSDTEFKRRYEDFMKAQRKDHIIPIIIDELPDQAVENEEKKKEEYTINQSEINAGNFPKNGIYENSFDDFLSYIEGQINELGSSYSKLDASIRSTLENEIQNLKSSKDSMEFKTNYENLMRFINQKYLNETFSFLPENLKVYKVIDDIVEKAPRNRIYDGKYNDILNAIEDKLKENEELNNQRLIDSKRQWLYDGLKRMQDSKTDEEFIANYNYFEQIVSNQSLGFAIDYILDELNPNFKKNPEENVYNTSSGNSSEENSSDSNGTESSNNEEPNEEKEKSDGDLKHSESDSSSDTSDSNGDDSVEDEINPDDLRINPSNPDNNAANATSIRNELNEDDFEYNLADDEERLYAGWCFATLPDAVRIEQFENKTGIKFDPNIHYIKYLNNSHDYRDGQAPFIIVGKKKLDKNLEPNSDNGNSGNGNSGNGNSENNNGSNGQTGEETRNTEPEPNNEEKEQDNQQKKKRGGLRKIIGKRFKNMSRKKKIILLCIALAAIVLTLTNPAVQAAVISTIMLVNSWLWHLPIAVLKVPLAGFNSGFWAPILSKIGIANAFNASTGVWTIAGLEHLSVASPVLSLKSILPIITALGGASLAGLGIDKLIEKFPDIKAKFAELTSKKSSPEFKEELDNIDEEELLTEEELKEKADKIDNNPELNEAEKLTLIQRMKTKFGKYKNKKKIARNSDKEYWAIHDEFKKAIKKVKTEEELAEFFENYRGKINSSGITEKDKENLLIILIDAKNKKKSRIAIKNKLSFKKKNASQAPEENGENQKGSEVENSEPPKEAEPENNSEELPALNEDENQRMDSIVNDLYKEYPIVSEEIIKGELESQKEKNPEASLEDIKEEVRKILEEEQKIQSSGKKM